MERFDIGQKIREARIGKGMTQADLAEALDVSQGAVGQWEQGITVPKFRNLVALSELFGIPVGDLLKVG